MDLTTMSPECLALGAAVSFLVSLLKRIPFIGKNPKKVAGVLNILIAAFPVFVKGTADMEGLVVCVLAQFAASVATYETVTAPVRRALSNPDKL